ncbi:hypothetical protein D3C84_1082220 [compost metagenome]
MLEKPWHATELAIPVFLAAFLDKLGSIGASQNMFSIESACSQYPNSMVMAQYKVFDRFGGVLAQLV